MKENGWYAEDGEEPRDRVGMPIDCLRKAFSETKINVNEDTLKKIYTEFVDGLVSAGYVKVVD
jgi:hypothetical protein